MPTLPQSARLSRPVPTGGTTEGVRGIASYDDVEGTPAEGDAKLATIVLFPALVWKVGHQLAAAHLNGEFPDDGTGLLPASPLAGGPATLKLAATALQNQAVTLDPRHLLVQLVDGPAAGHYRRITGWTAGTQTLTVNRDWAAGALPVAGNTYRLLLDCRYRSLLSLSAEMSADGLAATVRIVLYDWALDGAGTLRKPRRVYDLARQLGGGGVQITAAADIETTSRWVSETVTVQTRGFLGAKVRLVQMPASGNLDLFATAT